MVIALGVHRTGVFSNDQKLADLLFKIGEEVGEKSWVMPMDPEYHEQIKSDWADIKNSAGRPGGSITAAWFVRNFVGDTPWPTSTLRAAPYIMGEAKSRVIETSGAAAHPPGHSSTWRWHWKKPSKLHGRETVEASASPRDASIDLSNVGAAQGRSYNFFLTFCRFVLSWRAPIFPEIEEVCQCASSFSLLPRSQLS